MKEIDVSGPMALAFQSGDDTYQPVFPGTELELEYGQTKATLNNLNAILDSGNQEIAAFLLSSGQVMVVFASGNLYLATGFHYGHPGDEVHQFALFAAKHGFGNPDEIFAYLSAGLPPGESTVMTKPPIVSHDLIEESMRVFNGNDILPQRHVL